MANFIEFKDQKWIVEAHDKLFMQGYQADKILYSKKSEFQQVDIVETESYGRMLLNDDLIMLCERDEFAYHEMMVHVPMMVLPEVKKVLIIGGGDGGTAREVLRHEQVESCVMVEIDRCVVEACREFIPRTAKDLSHPKLTLLIEDGVKFVAETKDKFDLILVDSTDPIGPAAPLFGREFYSNIAKVLKDDGLVVSQGESGWYYPDTQKSMLEILGQFFPIASLYNFSNLTYPGGLWSFTFASKKYHPTKDFVTEKVSKSSLDFKYYNAEIHKAAFCLPQFMKDNLKGVLKA